MRAWKPKNGKMLVKTSKKKVITLLEISVEKTKSPNWETRYEGVQGIGQSGNIRFVNVVIRALTDENPKVRDVAIGHLGNFKCKKALDMLTKLARNRNPDIRLPAVYGLANLADTTSINLLIRRTNDIDAGVRICAGTGLERIGEKIISRAGERTKVLFLEGKKIFTPMNTEKRGLLLIATALNKLSKNYVVSDIVTGLMKLRNLVENKSPEEIIKMLKL